MVITNNSHNHSHDYDLQVKDPLQPANCKIVIKWEANSDSLSEKDVDIVGALETLQS